VAGWTITDWTGNSDWSAFANISDFQKALNERKLAIAVSADALLVVGDDVQACSLWSDMQGWIEANCTEFVVAYKFGSKLASDVYDEAATLAGIGYNSLSDLFERVGLATSDWRRYTTHPDDGGANQSDVMTVGSIIGPWLFEDLQLAMNGLIWTLRGTSVDGNARWHAMKSDNFTGSAIGEATWANAKTAAEAGAVAQSNEGEYFGAGPRVWNIGLWDAVNGYTAETYRNCADIKLTSVPTHCVPAFDFYAWAETVGFDPTHETFDANGAALVEERWKIWEMGLLPGAPAATVYSSTKLGQVTVGTWTADPNPNSYVGRGFRCQLVGSGNEAFSGSVMLRWDKGFTYH